MLDSSAHQLIDDKPPHWQSAPLTSHYCTASLTKSLPINYATYDRDTHVSKSSKQTTRCAAHQASHSKPWNSSSLSRAWVSQSSGHSVAGPAYTPSLARYLQDAVTADTMTHANCPLGHCRHLDFSPSSSSSTRLRTLVNKIMAPQRTSHQHYRHDVARR